MTHGYHDPGARGRRTRRRIRRGQLKPLQAHTSKNNSLKTRTFWTRYHPKISSFSYGQHIRKGRRNT